MRINILNSIVQLPKIEKAKCPPCLQPLSLAKIVFQPMNPNLKSRMCLFIITWKDGTQFNATSVTKEDIIEMCIKLGHTHLLGVLHYSVIESVAVFCSTEEMQHATCGAIKAMELQEEAIAIQAVAPLETHVKAYIIAVGGDSSKLQSSPSEEEGEPHSPHDNPHPSGEMSHHLQAELGNLANHELCQLVEDLCQITLCELNAPPAALYQCLGDTHQAAGMPKKATRRSPFQEGEDGFPWDNHLHLLPLHNQMEDGFLGDHLHCPHFLLNQIKTWGA